MRHHARPQPQLVTSAAQSREDEFNARRRRYIITMLLRAVLLVLALLTATISIWLAVVIGLISTVLPWIAVVMANEGPPKKRARPVPSAAKTVTRPDRRVIATGPVVIDENGSTVVDDPQEGGSA